MKKPQVQYEQMKIYRRRLPIASRHTYSERVTETHNIVPQDWPYCDTKNDYCVEIVVREWPYDDGSSQRAILVADDDDMDWDFDVSMWPFEECVRFVNGLAFVSDKTFDSFRRI